MGPGRDCRRQPRLSSEPPAPVGGRSTRWTINPDLSALGKHLPTDAKDYVGFLPLTATLDPRVGTEVLVTVIDRSLTKKDYAQLGGLRLETRASVVPTAAGNPGSCSSRCARPGRGAPHLVYAFDFMPEHSNGADAGCARRAESRRDHRTRAGRVRRAGAGQPLRPCRGLPSDEGKVAEAMLAHTANIKLLDHHLTGKQWVAQDHLTLADISLASTIAPAGMIGLTFDDVPNVAAWFARMQELPAWKATQA